MVGPGGSTGTKISQHPAGPKPAPGCGADRGIVNAGAAPGRHQLAYCRRLGVDGVFTDFADTGVAALAA